MGVWVGLMINDEFWLDMVKKMCGLEGKGWVELL